MFRYNLAFRIPHDVQTRRPDLIPKLQSAVLHQYEQIQRLLQRDYQQSMAAYEQCKSDQLHPYQIGDPLTIRMISGAFVIVYFGIIVAFVAFGIETVLGCLRAMS